MYSDWSSLTVQLQTLGTATQSVLAKLPQDDGKQVCFCVDVQLGCFKNVDMNSSPCTFFAQVQKCISMKICEKGKFFVKNPLGAAYFCDPDSL